MTLVLSELEESSSDISGVALRNILFILLKRAENLLNYGNFYYDIQIRFKTINIIVTVKITNKFYQPVSVSKS